MANELSDAFLIRRLRLSQACRRGLPQVIEGIEFDLNHPDLDRNNWEPESPLGDYLITGMEPSLVYPWTAVDHVARMRAAGSVVVLQPGDRVIISRVDTFAEVAGTLGKLDHPHHRERRLVYLSVIRDDAPIPAPGFWLFAGRADVMTPIFLDELDGVRRALINRFERMVCMEDLTDCITDFSEDDWNAQFQQADQDTQHTARMLWKTEDFQEHAAMAFGYLIGRAEAREGRQALAKTASKLLRKTGDKTRAAAIAEIDQTPEILRRRCAERVADRLEKNFKSVERTIAELFRQGADGSFRPDPAKMAEHRARLARNPNDASV